MIIQDETRYSKRWRLLGNSLYHKLGAKRLLLVLICMAALTVYTLLSVGVGMMLHKSGTVGGVIVPMLQTRLAVIPNYLTGQLFGRPEELAIDIKHVDYQKLAYKREQALRAQFLIASDDDYVPARIRYRGESLPVKLRLKGDMIDHLRWDKWSFRVKVKGNHTLMGMKVFSLQHPKTRNYLYEWVYHQALKRAGLITLRYDFVQVSINGKPMGIYAIEEHFSKELIENNRKREAPIVRFNEDLYWAQSLYLIDYPGRLAAENAGHFLASAVEPFKASKTIADPTLRAEFEYAAELLEAFRRGEIMTHQIFDVDKLANYMAIIEVMGTSEWNLDWTDQRFYYNPVTAKLEPIGFDGHVGYDNHELMGNVALTSIGDDGSDVISELPTRVFHDPVFYRAYVRALERYSDPAYLDTLLSELRPEIKTKLRILHRDYPYIRFDPSVFYRNQTFIRKMLNPVKGLHAYYERYEETPKGKLLTLQVGNIQGLPLEVTGATYLDRIPVPLVTTEAIIPARGEDRPVRYTQIQFRLPEGLIWKDAELSNLRVNYRVLGASTDMQTEIYPWRYLDPGLVRNDVLRHPPDLKEFPFLRVEGKHLLVAPGKWQLRKPLIIPEGYVFHIPAGATLDLVEQAMLVSRSPVEFLGTEDSPIRIHSSDATGQGIAIIEAHAPSTLEYVQFANLNAPSRPGWELTGAVTFYESDVRMKSVVFLDARSEDSLNVVRSDFQIVDSVFSGTASDAFDVDFGTGRVMRTRFVNLGNDALDLSGSVAYVQDCIVEQAGDKGISAGEASQVQVTGMILRGVRIALASKDCSQLIAEGVTVRDAEVGLTAFQKKPEFGPATIEVTGLDMQNTTEPFLVEIHSSAHVDGRSLVGDARNVANRFYGAEEQSAESPEDILQALSPRKQALILAAQRENGQNGAQLPF